MEGYIPIISPVTSKERPAWSVMIPVYNCIQFLQTTLESVLIQATGDMEIVVVDDCSTDGNVGELVYAVGKGRIKFVQQHENVGSLRNFETCLNISTGHFVHLLHGDDFVIDGFYRKMDSLFKAFPIAGAACCNIAYVNEGGRLLSTEAVELPKDGLLENWLKKIASRQRLQYCGVAVRREVYETLGGFAGVHFGEDWEMWARIAARYPFAYTPETLACYRRHSHSISGRSILNGQYKKDIKWVMQKILEYLPTEDRSTVSATAKKAYGLSTMSRAFSTWERDRDVAVTKQLMKGALEFYSSPYMRWRQLLLLIKMTVSRKKVHS